MQSNRAGRCCERRLLVTIFFVSSRLFFTQVFCVPKFSLPKIIHFSQYRSLFGCLAWYPVCTRTFKTPSMSPNLILKPAKISDMRKILPESFIEAPSPPHARVTPQGALQPRDVRGTPAERARQLPRDPRAVWLAPEPPRLAQRVEIRRDARREVARQRAEVANLRTMLGRGAVRRAGGCARAGDAPLPRRRRLQSLRTRGGWPGGATTHAPRTAQGGARCCWELRQRGGEGPSR
jgi:hypothetical protein